MLDISGHQALAKTQVGISTMMGASQHTACSGTTNCLNSSQQLVQMARKHSDCNMQGRSSSNADRSGKMTAIDDLQSSYAQFKIKQESAKEVKRKVKKALQMTETLVHYYLN